MNNLKQFGVWMDNHQAAIVGNANSTEDPLTVLAHINAEVITQNSSEKTVQSKFFK